MCRIATDSLSVLYWWWDVKNPERSEIVDGIQTNKNPNEYVRMEESQLWMRARREKLKRFKVRIKCTPTGMQMYCVQWVGVCGFEMHTTEVKTTKKWIYLHMFAFSILLNKLLFFLSWFRVHSRSNSCNRCFRFFSISFIFFLTSHCSQPHLHVLWII